jgi:peptide/nickel transport system substrate-binding protein
VISPTTWSFDQNSANLYRFNLEEAGRLLDEAGWKDTNGDGIREKNGKNLTLDYITSPVWEEAFNELLSGYLQKAGFEVKMHAMDDAGIASEAAAGRYSFLYMYWTRADPSPLRILFHSSNIKGGSAYTRFVNPELDKVLADGDTQTDENLRKQDYVTAQKIIMENALVLPLFTVNTVYLLSPSVQNFSFDLEGYPWIYDISLAK